MMTRTAVVLFNLGGPDSPESVQPFLNNLFNDPAIIGLPWPLRPVLASAISHRRHKEAQKIYALIGGRSPLLENTTAQAEALEKALDDDTRVFVAMRYWHPMSDDAAMEVAAFEPDRIVLLPLYPQYSTTTTASSFRAWDRAWRRHGRETPTVAVCCYPREEGLVASHARRVREALDEAGGRPVRILFSAHGLPEKIIRGGDPYQWQVEQTAAAIVGSVGREGLDWSVCYQSRVGPLTWIGPSTVEEIERAGRDGVGAVVVPLAFVSEHSETLVELDIEYRDLAGREGCRPYIRVASPGTEENFISGLAGTVRKALAQGRGCRICPPGLARCPRKGR